MNSIIYSNKTINCMFKMFEITITTKIGSRKYRTAWHQFQNYIALLIKSIDSDEYKNASDEIKIIVIKLKAIEEYKNTMVGLEKLMLYQAVYKQWLESNLAIFIDNNIWR